MILEHSLITASNYICRPDYLLDGQLAFQNTRKFTKYIHKIKFYFKTWKLSINFNKCKTISFKSLLLYANSNIESSRNDIDAKIILHKNIVKYLGINFDERLHYKMHIDIQLRKETQTFMGLRKLFYFKYLTTF
ncbi:hypothetical protein ALC56_06363 [Trachymyrmex septentrionalis]|uniref:Reverse transcriptase domain-containing protein n=1 Tax=Trachymyrmex septentrionalis TaxID=34720 RepID=A0A151JWW7_9HYME|nr:hypothetical protein ALC56_06363 [Trachymyrmex septentrionalis]